MLTLRAAGLLDVDAGEIVRPGIVRVDDDRIVGIGGDRWIGRRGEVIDLGDSILLPGLMDMEVNLLMGGRGENPGLSQVQDDPPTRVLRAVGNARRTLRAGFTTVRNLGLFVKTGGYLLDVALGKAIDAGWIEGPRVVPAGHAITPTGGHLDPTMFAAFMPGVLELTVEEGIANGVDEIRKAVRYQIKHGAQLIKVCCLGWRDVADRRGGGATLFGRGAAPRSSTRHTGVACGSPRTRTAPRRSSTRWRSASTASSTDS